MQLERAVDVAEASALSAGKTAVELPQHRAEISAKERPEAGALQDAVAENVEKTPAADRPVQSSEQQTLALPTGADKSGVTSQAISTPKGEGTIQGMGESFSAQLSTGIATFSVPFALPAARGGAQPSLGLSYSSGSGTGLAGMGWSVGVPFIARQTDRGLPKYEDCATWHPEQDRFVFNGGQELVPICTVTAEMSCAGALPGEVMPPWSANHQYFRPRVEGSFLRFFWSPDHLTWRVQEKSGVTMELGVPLDGSGSRDGLEVNPSPRSRAKRGCATTNDEIYRWHLVRQYDTYGDSNPAIGNPEPFNVVVYKYLQDGGQALLSDIFDTTPAASPTSTELADYAHHTRLVYEPRTDPTESYRSGWLLKQTQRLAQVDVTSKTFAATGGRRLVRRYHLEYDTVFHTSYLSSVQVEGRCVGEEIHAKEEAGDARVGATSCDKLPPMTFEYSHVEGYNTGGRRVSSGLDGYEAFDARLLQVDGSPDHPINEALTDYFDINSDGLPDLLVTTTELVKSYPNDYAVFFNSAGGVRHSFGPASALGIKGVLSGNSTTLQLTNSNVAPFDRDGDGTIDLVHTPKEEERSYAVYTPQLAGTKWSLVGSVVEVPDSQDRKIDLGQDAGRDTRVVDVNFDGLVDVVVSTGTELQTFLSLGRFPGGDGQFGQSRWTGSDSASLSTTPIATCMLYSSALVRFSDSDVRLADMNGDGIQDIVRLRLHDAQYWPGRGNGYWGTGKLDACPAGTFNDRDYVEMVPAPPYAQLEGTSLRMDDVNGDGLDDLVQVKETEVHIWLNVDGRGWTERHIIEDTPWSPSFAEKVHLIDINGSGTRDIVWGDGEDYRFMDLAGGRRPGLLIGVKNGLGKSTDIQYVSSTEEMLAAERTTVPCGARTNHWETAWCKKMPAVTHLVKRVTESDNLSIAGGGVGIYATEYHYRDPVFEGRQREFRGFRHARSKRFGDANSPTDLTESTFLLGECEDETADDVDDCSARDRWRDNPKEALKGLPLITERYDENGLYLSTQATTYRLRHLYTGLDGRAVRHVFESGQQTTLYDTAAAASAVATGGERCTSGADCLPLVELEPAAPAKIEDLTTLACVDAPARVVAEPVALAASFRVPLRASSGYATTRSEFFVDAVGNRLVAVAHGCVSGSACPQTDSASTLSADESICSFTEPSEPLLTGWMYRTQLAWSQGSEDTVVRSKTATTYTEQGAPSETIADLSHTLPLERYTTYSGRQPADDPIEASADGTFSAALRAYDEFGNVSFERGAHNRAGAFRCRSTFYDGDLATSGYAQFPIQEVLYVNGCLADEDTWVPIAGTELSNSAEYDRGTGLATVVTDMTGQKSRLTYDEFGRVVSMQRPRPDGAENSAGSSIAIVYDLPSAGSDRAYSIIRTQAEDGTPDGLRSYSYIDGMGRPRVGLTEADESPEQDGAPFILSSIAEFDAKGAVHRKYLPTFTSFDPEASTALPTDTLPPATPYGRQRYDAFGRQVQTFDIDGTVTLQTRYHALSTELWDAADLYPGPHEGSYAGTRTDGHGRTVATTERVHVGGTLEAREVRTKYLAGGQPQVVSRVRLSGDGTVADKVVRWLGYDSLGRMVVNVDPHSTPTASYTSTPRHEEGILAWHYVYNDAGDLVGTSDARGCGQNFIYDGVGRLKAEDYSPCVKEQATAVENPNLTTGAGYEVFYEYDDVPSASVAPPAGVVETSPSYRGRLRAVHDRAATTWFKYDARGRTTSTFRKVSYVGASQATVAGRYVDRWYQKDFAYDAADRPVEETTGVASDSELRATGGGSSVFTSYTERGTIKKITSSYGELVKGIKRTADGFVTESTLGDEGATKTAMRYDSRRRLASVQTFRSEADLWSMPPPAIAPAPSNDGPTRQLLLQDLDYSYDVVNNPIEVRDWRTAEEWPEGAKPVTRTMKYDDLYRVTRVDYEYPGGHDKFTSPYASELTHGATDARRPTPFGHKLLNKRPLWQTYKYDWLGNTSHTDDDQHAFFDRSMGTISNGAGGSGGSVGKPYQMVAASQSTAPHSGSIINVGYDATGNVNSYRVARSATACATSLSVCSQRYFYDWDEVGRLQFARRIEGEGPNAIGPRLDFLYDANDERVVKRHYFNMLSGANTPDVYTLYVFDSLEIRRGEFDATTLQHPVDSETEVAYLTAKGMRLARLHLEPEAKGEPRLATDPTLHDSRLHIFLNLPDHLGSSSLIVDHATGELVEARTYQPFGATESDYRPERWKGFREDYGFTGKEEDVEVGLQYFGKRYSSPQLGRWLSADPLEVHQPGSADRNLYAYVRGAVLKAVDPNGLLDSLEPTERQWLRDHATENGVRSGHADARTLAKPASSNPLSSPDAAKKLGLKGPATHYSPDHIMPFAEIADDPRFASLTAEQQLSILREKENLIMVDKRINQKKGDTPMVDFAEDHGINSDELKRLDSKARAAIETRITSAVAENTTKRVNVAQADVNFLGRFFGGERLTQMMRSLHARAKASARPVPSVVVRGAPGAKPGRTLRTMNGFAFVLGLVQDFMFADDLKKQEEYNEHIRKEMQGNSAIIIVDKNGHKTIYLHKDQDGT